MKSKEAQIEERMAVWVALSDLFLDSELQSEDLDRIAAKLAASPYSATEAEDIRDSRSLQF